MTQDGTGRLKMLAAVAAIACLIAGPGVLLAETTVNANKPVIVSDDITNRTTDVVSASGGTGNHGHGNNEDGVDSSNPGEGSGGPSGAEDPSGDTDDEGKGGGSIMAKGK